MNKLLFAQIALITSLILSSCGTSNQVVSNKLISKRKYTKGFYINSKDHRNGSNDEIAANEEKVEKNNNKSAEEVILTQAGSVEDKESQQQTNTTSDKSLSNNEQSSSTDVNTIGEGFTSKGKIKNQFSKKSQIKSGNIFKSSHKTIRDSKKTIKQHIAKKASSDNSFMQILLIVILVVLLIAIFSFLDSALGGTLSLILGIIVLAFLIWLVLRLLGVI